MLGLFKYPGLYPRLDPKEKLSTYVERAGGIKDDADLSGAILYRNKTDQFRQSILGGDQSDSLMNLKEPVSIDLYNAMKYKNSKYDIVLQPNDVIYIPEINPFVSIKGVVQSPLKMAFDEDHRNLGYYIDKAGGFGIRPWRKRIYVTYADGKSRRTHNFCFIHFYPKVKEGATITVPERPQVVDLANTVTQAFTATIPIILTAILFKYINK